NEPADTSALVEEAVTPPAVAETKVNGHKASVLIAAPTIIVPQVSLLDLVDEPLVNGKLCCPFHDDGTPSCHIYADLFFCYGCNAVGDSVDWLMMIEGLDRDAALDVLQNGTLNTPPARARTIE